MITDFDRSGWFGASDTHYIMSNKWNGETFKNFWLVKTGVKKVNFQNRYTRFGTYAEHNIIDYLNRHMVLGEYIKKGIRPVYKHKYKIRVNHDGITPTRIVEIKTSKRKVVKPHKNYIQQSQVLMFAENRKKTELVYYYPKEIEYKYHSAMYVNKNKLDFFTIEYDEEFIKNYLYRIEYLKHCMKNNINPCIDGIEGCNNFHESKDKSGRLFTKGKRRNTSEGQL